MSDTDEGPQVTDAELDAELAEKTRLQEEFNAQLKNRVFNMTNAMQDVLAQFEASNSELLGAAFTLASRLIRTSIEVAGPTVIPEIRMMVHRLLLNTADPKPADANIQGLTEVIDAEPVQAVPTPTN